MLKTNSNKLIFNPRWNQTFPEKNYKGQYCASPFVSVEIISSGRVRMCGCSSWMPATIGNIFESSILDLLNSEKAKKIRSSIIDGDYKYCDEKICGVITNHQLVPLQQLPEQVQPLINDPEKFVMPSEIFFAGDDTCNLSCPSCRNRVTKLSEQQKQELESLGEVVKRNLFGVPTEQRIALTISTSGEVFASPLLLKFLNSISTDDFPNLRINLQTNGLLAKKNWHKILHLDRLLDKVTVSIDAANKETYEKLRRGGVWEDLLESLEFLQEKKQNLGFQLITRMVVQKNNFDQMPDFYDFSKRFSADLVEYTKLTNWVWTEEEYLRNDVSNPAHPDWSSFQQKLDEIQHHPNVWLSGLNLEKPSNIVSQVS